MQVHVLIELPINEQDYKSCIPAIQPILKAKLWQEFLFMKDLKLLAEDLMANSPAPEK